MPIAQNSGIVSILMSSTHKIDPQSHNRFTPGLRTSPRMDWRRCLVGTSSASSVDTKQDWLEKVFPAETAGQVGDGVMERSRKLHVHATWRQR